MREQNVTAVRSFFELFGAGKAEEAAATLLADDFELINLLPEEIPFGGRYRGAAGFLQYLGEIMAAITMESFEVDEIFGDGDRVTVVGREVSSVQATGRRYEMDWVHVFRVVDGLIQEMREYNDTARMLAAFQADR
ncbi:MAG: hypothetical protein CL908_26145 [Deltaproteobacteria bacterium]|jgi:hypothetical protein|nr:hypothetical protein [Deltaproteobacteria bacterium]